MELKLCPTCKKPYLASEEFCPRCPQPVFDDDPESYGTIGCVLITVAGLVILMIFWIFIFLGIFFH
jgi:uncharacterized paraquat-inducible protein A